MVKLLERVNNGTRPMHKERFRLLSFLASNLSQFIPYNLRFSPNDQPLPPTSPAKPAVDSSDIVRFIFYFNLVTTSFPVKWSEFLQLAGR